VPAVRERLPDNARSILTHAAVEVRLSEIPTLRDAPGPATAPPLPNRFLRYCDEQTVVGMAAVLRAIDRLPGQRPAFDRWGVVAASCQAGRLLGAATVIGTRKAGSQGVSPHVVPQCSLHSQASAVSVALSMHGAHFGIGGGPEAFDEGLLAACSMVSQPLWLILTAWETEPTLDGEGNPTSDPVCRGLAVALLPGEIETGEATVVVVPGRGRDDPATSGDFSSMAPSMAARIQSPAESLSGDAADARTTLPLRHGFTLALHRSEAVRLLALEAA